MQNKLITVIIPFYECEKYFEKCLESVINQTYKNLEILLFDDCGTDSCIDIAKKYEKRDHRIRIIRNQRNSGQGYSRNRGIEIAKGEYIGFVDADDTIAPQMYELLLQRALETDADITKCQVKVIYTDKTVLWNFRDCYPVTNKIYNAHQNPMEILGRQITSCWNGIYKKSLIVDNNIKFDEINKFEDMPFCWETNIKAQKIAFCPATLYFYNKTNEISDTASNEKLFKYIIIELENIKKIIKNNQHFHMAYKKYVYMSIDWLKSLSGANKSVLNKKQKNLLKDITTTKKYYEITKKQEG